MSERSRDMGHQNGTRNVVHLFCAGRFGEAVQQHMLRYRDELVCTAAANADALKMEDGLKSAKMLALAAWRSDRKLCASLDRVAHDTGKPFIPLMIEQNKVRLGPVVVPGRSCCWTCWNRRAQQNFPWQAARHALLEFYEAHPESGPEGYLETIAAVAAAKMAQVLADAEKDQVSPGLVWQLDLITRQVDTYTAIGIHDCPRCGLQRPPQTRSVDFMSRELEWLWKQQLSNPNA
jgi:bacteriocin biosynthesis cyclodehydratase domain-containing protein